MDGALLPRPLRTGWRRRPGSRPASSSAATCSWPRPRVATRPTAARRRTCARSAWRRTILSPQRGRRPGAADATDDVIHGFWTPDEGRANPVDVTMSMAKGARHERRADLREHRGHRLRHRATAASSVSAPSAAPSSARRSCIAAGLWGRELAAKAGVTVPLQAAEHYYLLTEPIDGVTPGVVPVIEDPEAYGYYREEGGGLLVGMFEPVGAAVGAGRHAARESAFAVLPPDWDRLAPFLEKAMQRFPALEDAGIRTLFCGPESFTDDLVADAGRVARGGRPLPRLRPELRRHPLRRRPRPRHGAVADRGVPADRPHRGRRRPHPRVPGDPAVPRGADRRAAGLPAQRPVLAERPAEDGAQRPRGRRSTPSTSPTAPTSSPSSGWEYPDYFAGPGVTPTVEWGFDARRGVRAHPRGAPQRPRERRRSSTCR